MPLTSDHQAIFDRLKADLAALRPTLDLLDRYYDGAQRFEQLGLAIPPDLQRFSVIVNWPRVVADARADRLDPKGFRLPGKDEMDVTLWELWQSNNMDEQDLMARLDYQVYGRSFHCVGGNVESTTPIITVESPRQVITDRDPRTGIVRAALRLYKTTPTAIQDNAATLYLPNETIHMISGGGWQVESSTVHNLGRVPVVPAFRGRRTALGPHRSFQGTSSMADVIPITDAAARLITNVQVAQETHAVPLRWVAGMTKGEFVDKSGQPLPVWEAYFGAIMASGKADAKFGQFESSDMGNFETMQTLYAKQASSVTGMPTNYFGIVGDQASSAESKRADENPFVKSVERDQVVLGNAREEVMRVAAQIKSGEKDPALDQMECLWYDAGTPTYASRVDAVVKQYAVVDGSGRSLISRETALEELGWSPQRIQREKERLDAEQKDPYMARIAEKDAAAVPSGS